MESEGTRLLVECGRPIGEVVQGLQGAGIRPEQIDAVLLTHAHADHSRSAQAFSDRFQVPLYASAGTLAHPVVRATRHPQVVRDEERLRIGEIEITPFAVPHDCAEPLGFSFESASGRMCLATDLGWVPESVQAHLVDLDLLVLEANYDPQLLRESRYPSYLKTRVAGRRGHLSNEDSADALAQCASRAPHTVWLAHISENTNTHRTAKQAFEQTLKQRGLQHIRVGLTQHRKPSLAWQSGLGGTQLGLW